MTAAAPARPSADPRSDSPAVHVFEHRWLSYKRTFRASVFSSFLSPVLFLTAMGLGLGTYVDAGSNAALGGVTYIQFLAPGLLAATAMQSAAFEATFPIMAGIMWNKVFHAMAATPISVRDIAAGNLAWIAARLTMISTVFTLVIIAFGAAAAPTIVLAIPAAVLTGMAFAAPIAAFATTQYNPNKFNAIFRFGILPLFLFSGTFYPISSLPEPLQVVAWLTPLFHGVELTRALSLGTVSADPLAAVIDVAYLSIMFAIGVVALVRLLEKRMVPR
jgi:lipooligosaccharide transport system permease protein